MSRLCQAKHRYGSSHEVLSVLRARQREIDYPLFAYRCQDPRCAGFHLTRVKPPDSARLFTPERFPCKVAA